MKLTPLLLGVLAALPLHAANVTFKKQTLTTNFVAEGCAIADFDHDGQMDITAGCHIWYGPDFTRRANFTPPSVNAGGPTKTPYDAAKGYSDYFLAYAQVGIGVNASFSTLNVNGNETQVAGAKLLFLYGVGIRARPALTADGSIRLTLRLEVTRMQRGYMSDTWLGGAVGVAVGGAVGLTADGAVAAGGSSSLASTSTQRTPATPTVVMSRAICMWIIGP